WAWSGGIGGVPCATSRNGNATKAMIGRMNRSIPVGAEEHYLRRLELRPGRRVADEAAKNWDSHIVAPSAGTRVSGISTQPQRQAPYPPDHKGQHSPGQSQAILLLRRASSENP